MNTFMAAPSSTRPALSVQQRAKCSSPAAAHHSCSSSGSSACTPFQSLQRGPRLLRAQQQPQAPRRLAPLQVASVDRPAASPSEPTGDWDLSNKMLKYKRVMLKVSGEALEGQNGYGIEPQVLQAVAKEVAAASLQGVQVAIVVGGGNFFRGVDRWDGLDRATADYVGMLATVMNAICLQSALESVGVQTRVQTAIAMQEVAEPYIRRRAIRHLERGRVVIFGAGTGNPFFTTDTAAALRAAEIDADAFFKATKVDGVYTSDPVKDPTAKLLSHVSYRQVMTGNLQVMDETAITLCKENNIPVVVFNITKPGNIMKVLMGDMSVGTTVNMHDGDFVNTAP